MLPLILTVLHQLCISIAFGKKNSCGNSLANNIYDSNQDKIKYKIRNKKQNIFLFYVSDITDKFCQPNQSFFDTYFSST